VLGAPDTEGLLVVSSPATLVVYCRYAANQTASLGASQAVVDVRHRLTLQPQDGCFVLYVEAAVSLFALALQVRHLRSFATVAALKNRSSRRAVRPFL
jgi:hypothetical protein